MALPWGNIGYRIKRHVAFFRRGRHIPSRPVPAIFLKKPSTTSFALSSLPFRRILAVEPGFRDVFPDAFLCVAII